MKWADKILHPPQRIDKLGVKPEMCVAIVGIHDEDFHEELKARRADVVMKVKKAPDLLFFAANQKADLKRLASFVKVLKPAGAVWVVYPKGMTQIKENDVLAAGRAAGFVDTKVASFSATHTALKFMIPVAQRGTGRKS